MEKTLPYRYYKVRVKRDLGLGRNYPVATHIKGKIKEYTKEVIGDLRRCRITYIYDMAPYNKRMLRYIKHAIVTKHEDVVKTFVVQEYKITISCSHKNYRDKKVVPIKIQGEALQ